MLNVRSFLDHNRIYKIPKNNYDNIICNSTGAFAFRGRWIPNNELKQNLIEHFQSWYKYVSKFGLLITLCFLALIALLSTLLEQPWKRC